MKRILQTMLIAAVLAGTAYCSDERVRDRWDFKLKDFIIGAWWGPGPTDLEMKYYKDAGFNVVMVGRYMEQPDYAHPALVKKEMDMAQKHGLWAMIDSYTLYRWDGDQKKPVRRHHADLEEMKWIVQHLGNHPACAGILIGDDQYRINKVTKACTDYLLQQPKPHLIPWICGVVPPWNLAQNGNPISNPQIYPTLYQAGRPAWHLARSYCSAYGYYSSQSRDNGVIWQPMINIYPPSSFPKLSDSLVRFPAYAAIAFGAEGLWYFTYGRVAYPVHPPNASEEDKKKRGYSCYTDEKQLKSLLTPIYYAVKEVNTKIKTWGPLVLGRRWEGCFGLCFQWKQPRWPFLDEIRLSPERYIAPPQKNKLIVTMDKDLLVGLLTKKGERPLAVVVDCRTSKKWNDIPRREATVTFNKAVTAIDVLDPGNERHIEGNAARVRLLGGDGVMLRLTGAGLDKLCATDAIYAPDKPTKRCEKVSDEQIANIRRALLRIDVFDTGSRAGLCEKKIYLNGRELAAAPATDCDVWYPRIIELTKDQLAWIKRKNAIEIKIGEGEKDPWGFRNLQLAVQLPDGSWAETNMDKTLWASSDAPNRKRGSWRWALKAKRMTEKGTPAPIELTLP